MADAVNQVHQEFWRPPATETAFGQERTNTCDECNTEFIVGSRYCHACGASRGDLTLVRTVEVPGLNELSSLGKRLGLTVPAVTAFLLGLICLLGALGVGVVYTARTALDWQAIQLWRIEWLLMAIAAFGAGLLLKKTS